ncbi:MAG: heme-binding protein [Polyangiaceae bacterium]
MTDNDAKGASINLPGGFHFNQVKGIPEERLKTPLDFAPPLGLLTQFTGTFAGKGFNLIFRPQSAATPTPLPRPAQGPSDNILELNLTSETLAFSPPLGSVPNRGMVQGDVFLNGVPYVQTVADITNGAPVAIHFEPGIWLAVPTTTNPAEPLTFVRMASIPHGTTINLQGTASATIAGPPNIPSVDPTPFLSGPRTPIAFPSQTAGNVATFRIPQDLSAQILAGTITQAILNDPNTVLRNAIVGQNIVETVVIEVASAPEAPVVLPIPAAGGGTANIAFLTGTESANTPNAEVPRQQPAPGGRVFAGVKSTFWIETVEHVITLPPFHPGQGPVTLPGDPPSALGVDAPRFTLHPPFPIPRPTKIRVRSTQIQYSQVVLLNFNGLTWPHVSVATLVPSTPIIPPPSVWTALQKHP